MVDLTSAYNTRIGRSLIHQVGAVVSTYHLTMLYVSDRGILARLRGNQHKAREYYITTLNFSRTADTSRREANCLDPKRMRRVVECGHVGMATLDVREEFVPTIWRKYPWQKEIPRNHKGGSSPPSRDQGITC